VRHSGKYLELSDCTLVQFIDSVSSR